ncbi:glycoside hydrolase family 32 protein [Pedobacter psychrodurus]|uniref:Glycoside hydrolase family 32 protein n=1 Tax=Pedobacter psychrodurus TaxID=2530456 RepID=A0A4R0PZY1_9SPHI|nr:glycoside hydrolase family 32 protein [Pedobacter psychrodurus]TCD28933.1 glycoside hydrolase family 32 protein [Pedobacter psychrodurus]
MKNKFIKPAIFLLCSLFSIGASAQSTESEKYRPAFHFSPKAHWMNDPNGMVYYKGVYHLFFQYHPGGTTWGPMHWGHAVTRDLFNWEEKPIALYPDSLGMIFSGSTVIDKDNTAGFGKNAMVAIFTHHNQKIEEAKTGLHQYQSIAYSTDEGAHWTKYKGNPVLPNPGITDFRDPKVMWFEQGKKWIMTLATKDRITFYSSPNLKTWKRESEFGANLGAHGGVWECPDLFPLKSNGKTVWVLLVSINPGGPNGGSATQYFTGSFDGNKFTPNATKEKWVDYGTDNYAGVTWSNTGDRKIFLGWMNNWQYANQVPTKAWRGAMTIARELSLENVGNDYYLRSVPVKEIGPLLKSVYNRTNFSIGTELNLSSYIKSLNGKFKLDLGIAKLEKVDIVLENRDKEQLIIGYDEKNDNYFIDRRSAGNTSFEKGFAKKHVAPRSSKSKNLKLSLILDETSVELFSDNGLTVMTDIFFPHSYWDTLKIRTSSGVKLSDISVWAIDLKKSVDNRHKK